MIIDHVGKGERDGSPVSHSGLGASVKGGAARLIAELKRTSKDNGGKWALDVESHFGSWDEPLYYERPKIGDAYGSGCVPCGAAEAFGVDRETVASLFRDRGQKDEHGRPFFPSQRALTAALVDAKLASGHLSGADVIRALRSDYSPPNGPMLIGSGPRNAVTFTWGEAR